MTLTELITLLQYRCGNRDDLTTPITVELALVQSTHLERAGSFLPWFLESDLTTLSTVAGDMDVAFPADYLAEIEGSTLWYQAEDLSWKKLVKKPYDYIQEKNLEAGAPKYYHVGATGFLIGPTPDAIYTLRFRYYKKDSTVSAGTDTNLWLTYAQDLIVAEVGARVCKYHTRDAVGEERFLQDAIEARSRLFVVHESKQHVNRRYGMGED